MSILSLDELRQRVQEVVGEDSSDSALSFIEDVEDTFNSLSENSGEDWRKKYEENDASWRKKYKDRFFSSSKEKDDGFDDPDEPPKIKTFEELFKEG